MSSFGMIAVFMIFAPIFGESHVSTAMLVHHTCPYTVQNSTSEKEWIMSAEIELDKEPCIWEFDIPREGFLIVSAFGSFSKTWGYQGSCLTFTEKEEHAINVGQYRELRDQYEWCFWERVSIIYHDKKCPSFDSFNSLTVMAKYVALDKQYCEDGHYVQYTCLKQNISRQRRAECQSDVKMNASQPGQLDDKFIIFVVCGSIGGLLVIIILTLILALSVRHCRKRRQEEPHIYDKLNLPIALNPNMPQGQGYKPESAKIIYDEPRITRP